MLQSGLGLIDSHAHIQGKEYAGETAAVIQRAGEAGVGGIIVVGGAGNMSSNTAAVALAESCANLYATVGMHPHDAKDVGQEELRELRELVGHPNVIAVCVGEQDALHIADAATRGRNLTDEFLS